jgi:sulfite dehydrogenase (quinone) subunit SoeC
MILFTTLAGAAQGLLLVLVGLDLTALAGLQQVPRTMLLAGAALVLAFSAIGLVAASFHLGHPLRAWRAAAMWRSSWLSREVIVLPAFMATVAAWAASHWLASPMPALGVVAALLALLLYLCTGMIYGAVKAIPAWATPLTPLNFGLIGLASGVLLAAALATVLAPTLAPPLAGLASLATVVAAAGRAVTLRRSLRPVEKTTLQTALGVRHPRIRQISQGTMGGSFNTREFQHGHSAAAVLRVRWAAGLAGFLLPALALLLLPPAPALLVALSVIQLGGLLAERWHFFAEARHTQNLYASAVG